MRRILKKIKQSAHFTKKQKSSPYSLQEERHSSSVVNVETAKKKKEKKRVTEDLSLDFFPTELKKLHVWEDDVTIREVDGKRM